MYRVFKRTPEVENVPNAHKIYIPLGCSGREKLVVVFHTQYCLIFHNILVKESNLVPVRSWMTNYG